MKQYLSSTSASLNACRPVQPALNSTGRPRVPPAKKRGAPRGNTNALKHGFYSKVLQEQGPAGVSRSVVMDFRGEIVVIKDLIFRLYKQGFTSKDAEETASCLRAISWASLALCRLVQTQDEFTPLKPSQPLGCHAQQGNPQPCARVPSNASKEASTASSLQLHRSDDLFF